MERWYYRFYQQKLAGLLKAGKVLLIYGPRRAGKTSLIKHFLANYEANTIQGWERIWPCVN